MHMLVLVSQVMEQHSLSIVQAAPASPQVVPATHMPVDVSQVSPLAHSASDVQPVLEPGSHVPLLHVSPMAQSASVVHSGAAPPPTHTPFVQVSPLAVSQSASVVQPPPWGAPQVPLASQMPLQHSVSFVHASPSAVHVVLSPQTPLPQIALQHSPSDEQGSPSGAHSTVPLQVPLASHVPLQHSDES